MTKFTLPTSFKLPGDYQSILRMHLYGALIRLIHSYLTTGIPAPPGTLSDITGEPVKFIRPPYTLQTVQAALDQIKAILFQSKSGLVFTGDAVQFRSLEESDVRELEILVLACNCWLVARERHPSLSPAAARLNVTASQLPATFVHEDGSESVHLLCIVPYPPVLSKDL